VPTLVDGEVVLTESAAIVNYAAMLSPAKELLPTAIAERARYDEICYFVMTDLEQPLWSIGKHRFALPEEVRQPGMQKTAQFEFEKSLRALRHHFDGSGMLQDNTLRWLIFCWRIPSTGLSALKCR
jgi:glutathione S-transferase